MKYKSEILRVTEERLETIDQQKVYEGGRLTFGEDYHRDEAVNGEEILKWVNRDGHGWVEPHEVDWLIGLFGFEVDKAWDRFRDAAQNREAVKDLIRYERTIEWLEAQK